MAFEDEEQNLGESEVSTKDSAIKSGIGKLGEAKEKREKLKDGAEKFIKIIKTLIAHKGILIVLAIAIFLVVFIVNAGAALYFLNWDTKNRTMKSKDKAFGDAVLERRN